MPKAKHVKARHFFTAKPAARTRAAGRGKNSKGISSISPALARSGYAGWFPQNNFYPNGVLSVGGG
jgi:hypothetical protein